MTRQVTTHWHSARQTRAAFTIVELTVVVVIVLILLGIALPAASTLWSQRKVAEAENILQGALNNARARAVSAGGVETGLFFYVDRDGVQHIDPIEQDSPGDLLRQNAFRFSTDRGDKLPPPMRVCPRYAVDPPSGTGGQANEREFSVAELANGLYEREPDNIVHVGQRHRNFFTLIYNRNGQLNVWRDVLILDPTSNVLNNDDLGDRTGLYVGRNSTNPQHSALKFYRQSPNNADAPINPTNDDDSLQYVIQQPIKYIAVNFPSVDGLILYNDQEYRDQGAPPFSVPDPNDTLRRFLVREGQPFYISRLTGEVIRGPLAEGAT